MESNNVDNDDVHVNVATINDVELLYVSKIKQPDSDDSSDDDGKNANHCFCNSIHDF